MLRFLVSRKQLRCQHLLSLRESMQNACRRNSWDYKGRNPVYCQQEWVHTLCYKMSKSTTDNEYGFTPYANGRCQSLLQTTSMGLHPMLMVDVKVYYSQRVWVHTLC